MSKVDIRRLDSVTANDTTATALINENFEKLQAGIEDALSRTGKTPNFMDADFDMNSRRIINCGEAVEDNDVVTYKVVKDAISTAQESATSAANSAAQAATSAQSALVSSTSAINAVRNAEDTLNLASGLLTETQQYVEAAKEDVNTTVTTAIQEINSTIDDAQMNLSDTIQQAVEDVKREAVEAVEGTINDAAATATGIVVEYTNNEIKPELVGYKDVAEISATLARAWATGTDDEVQAIEKDEHSSRTYANFSMALANAPEDVPVLESTLLATDVVKGEAEFSGDVTFTGTFDVHSDSNHPVKITGMAGTSATGYQIVDSNGLGDSDFEHYATGDRYGTKITNHNNTSNTSVSIDLYQSNVGKSVLDLTDVDTVLIPAPSVTDNTQRPATTEWVNNAMADVSKISADETITGAKTFEQTVDSKGFYISRTETPYTETPSATIEKGIVVRAEGNTNIASLLGIQYASGTNRVQMQVRGKAGTSRIMYVQEATDGKVTYNYGQTVGSQWIKMPKGAGTAVLICWGNVSAADMAESKTVTFPTSFSETPRVALTSSGGSTQVYQNVVNNITSTNFKAISSGSSASQGFHWIAVGNAAL